MNKKILVVDDSYDIALTIKQLLIVEGYDITIAGDGEEALIKIKELNPDLVLTDIMMPKKNGYELCKAIKKNKKTQFIPVIMITALSKREERIKGIEVGADDFLTKPFDMQELLIRVKSLLRIKSLYDEIEQKNNLLYKISTHYVTDGIFSKIIKDPEKHLKLGGEKRCVTILFADIRGFTRFSEQNSPDKIVEVLNNIFPELIKCVFKNKGIFDKYLGDGFMVFFNTSRNDKFNALRAINSALEMQEVFAYLKQKYEILSSLGLGIGINTGEVIVGNIGSENMMNYTVIGDPVNITQRLQEIAASDQILISGNTYQFIKQWVSVKEMSSEKVKGKQNQVEIFELIKIIQKNNNPK